MCVFSEYIKEQNVQFHFIDFPVFPPSLKREQPVARNKSVVSEQSRCLSAVIMRQT